MVSTPVKCLVALAAGLLGSATWANAQAPLRITPQAQNAKEPARPAARSKEAPRRASTQAEPKRAPVRTRPTNNAQRNGAPRPARAPQPVPAVPAAAPVEARSPVEAPPWPSPAPAPSRATAFGANPSPSAGAQPREPDLAFGAFQRGHYLTAFNEAQRRASAQGDVKAMTLLGELYSHGLGVPRDHTRAVEWYSLAADRGDREAMYALALLRFAGLGGQRDRDAAVRLLQEAAQRGHVAPVERDRALHAGAGRQ